MNLQMPINDYELLYMIYQDDEMAMKYLLDKYDNYLWSTVNRIFDNENISIKEEYHLEARSKLLEAVYNYKDNTGASFMTFMTVIINRKLRTLRNRSMIKQNVNQASLSLDWVIQEESPVYLSEIVEDRKENEPAFQVEMIRLAEIAESFVAELSLEDRKIWNKMINNVPYQVAAEELNITCKKYDNRVFRIKKRFVKCLKDLDEVEGKYD